MKSIFVCLAFLLLAEQPFAQVGKDNASKKEEYLRKSRNQKTTGWVLLGGGTAVAVAGAVIFANSGFLSGDPNADLGGVMFLTGVSADLASIPFFILSSGNAHKAATLGFRQQKIWLPGQNAFVSKPYPSVTLTIDL